MSHETYNLIWEESQNTLDSATRLDVEQQSAKPSRDKDLCRSIVASLYTKYARAANGLDECYDQMVQPQKRQLVKRLLENSIGRMLELKHELVNVDLSEFSYYDDVLLGDSTVPSDAEPRVPLFYTQERLREIEERRSAIDDILRGLGYYEEEEEGEPMSEERAVRLVQVHERARQGRLRAQFMREIRQMKEKVKTTEARVADTAVDTIEESGRRAAMNIQRVWRGHITRTKIRRRVVEEMVLIGMLRPPTTEVAQRQRAQEVKELRRTTRLEYQDEYDRDIAIEKEKIKTTQGAKMMERMVDEVRTWFMSYKNQTGKFPDLPSEEAGGSAIIFSKGGAESERSTKSTAASSRDSKGRKSGSGSKRGSREREEAKKRKEEEEEDLGFKMGPSNFLADLMVAATEYLEVWRHMDETANPQQRHYNDIVRQEKALEVESELRKIVDVQLRAELEHLQAAVDRDRAKKGKKPKKAAKKKSRRAGKKSKKKKEKDLTPDRSVESLLEELVANGIIKRYPQVPLSSFLGERSWANGELRNEGKDPLPTLGDIRQVILEFCILPLGSKVVHLNAPLVKSLLVAGPEGSGKRLLVNAVCTETGATLFDLSPANIVGKYPGKSGLIMLMHLVSKVSRLLQPSVIFIDGAEKTFMKKVPKTDRTDPKRLKKDLPKLVKLIGPEDQVILIGTSRCPWECDQKLLAQTYNKMLLIPKPDYASRSLVWSEQLFQYSGLSREFNTSSLARISDGFTVGTILATLKEVLTCKRVLQLRVHQLTHAEIVNALCKYEPIYKEQEEAFLVWYSKTPIGRRKTRAIELEAERLLEKTTKRKKLA